MPTQFAFIGKLTEIVPMKVVSEIVAYMGNFTQSVQIEIVNHLDFSDTFNADPLWSKIWSLIAFDFISLLITAGVMCMIFVIKVF